MSNPCIFQQQSGVIPRFHPGSPLLHEKTWQQGTLLSLSTNGLIFSGKIGRKPWFLPWKPWGPFTMKSTDFRWHKLAPRPVPEDGETSEEVRGAFRAMCIQNARATIGFCLVYWSMASMVNCPQFAISSHLFRFQRVMICYTWCEYRKQTCST